MREVFADAQKRPPYPSEFRRQMVELVRAGRDPNDPARELEPSAPAILDWVAAADRSEGRREAKPPPAALGLTAAERAELGPCPGWWCRKRLRAEPSA